MRRKTDPNNTPKPKSRENTPVSIGFRCEKGSDPFSLSFRHLSIVCYGREMLLSTKKGTLVSGYNICLKTF